MSQKHSFSRFVYFDTNILSQLAKNKNLWEKLRDFLFNNDLTIALSAANLCELSEASRIHDALTTLITVPSVLTKPSGSITDAEVKVFPNEHKEDLILFHLNSLLFKEKGFDEFKEWSFKSEAILDAREDQKIKAKIFEENLNDRKDNFPTSDNGTYTVSQVELFSSIIICQLLKKSHLRFLENSKNDFETFCNNISALKTLYLLVNVIFYKYYLDRRTPKKVNDFSDLAHISLIPYCKLAVMERDMCNTLKKIKKRGKILQTTHIRNINFLKDWELKDD